MTPALAYFSGEDAFAIDLAILALARELGGKEAPAEIWRVNAEEETPSAAPAEREGGASAPARRQARILDEIEQRVGTAPLFGTGTLVVVRQPGALIGDRASRERLTALAGAIRPGNGLVFSELVSGRATRTTDALRQAVAAAGGEVREFAALTRERMERWIEARAGDLGVTLAPGAARLLAERVGAYVREGDIDRRRQSQLANAELQKLALFRPGAVVSREDVQSLVPEAIPGSMWGLLDAVAARQTREAATLVERLLADGMPLPVIVSQLHRRLREVLEVREHLSSGAKPGQLVRLMGMQPYRAQKVAEQAAAWRIEELESALEGLLGLDVVTKGIALDGRTQTISDERSALELDLWLVERVVRPSQQA
ncbi:MAG: DNA polymerase III subunit delta [Chloroflexota bacterium]|nr:DNA polymerase III subunit delta [Chloroflexota bacterium]